MIPDKKYLLTGASGQLGSEWKRALEAAGASFTAADSSELDITDRKSVMKIMEKLQPDVVINCAAYTNVDGAENPDSLNESVNHHGAVNLAEACRNHGALLVHYSTDYVFSGKKGDKELYPTGYPEDAELNPINEYGRSKLAGEEAIRRSGAHHLILRVSWLCSAFGNNFMKTMLRIAASGKDLSVVDDQFGAPTFTFDVVDLTSRLITLKKTGTFHLQCDETLSWYNFAVQILIHAGYSNLIIPVDSSAYPVKAKRPAFSKLDTTKLKQATGTGDIKALDGIRRVLRELKSENPISN